MKINYDSNNSGGSWWLKDEDWKKLEEAGWQVEWYATKDNRPSWFKDDNAPERFLGALASRAHKDFETPADAMREFEKITGQDVTDEGCNCCGAPHRFNWGEGAKYGWASGEECLEHLYGDEVPSSLREAMELLRRERP